MLSLQEPGRAQGTATVARRAGSAGNIFDQNAAMINTANTLGVKTQQARANSLANAAAAAVQQAGSAGFVLPAAA